MKKHFLSVALVCALAGALTLPSCIGSFSLTNKLLSWNNTIDSKFINELVFIAFCIVPVYEVSALADILVLNSIEFWSGTSPVAKGKTVIDGKDGKYLVDCDGKGYTITSLTDNSVCRLDFDEESRTWSVIDSTNERHEFMTFVDESHVKMTLGNGDYKVVEISEAGLYAYQAAILLDNSLALK